MFTYFIFFSGQDLKYRRLELETLIIKYFKDKFFPLHEKVIYKLLKLNLRAKALFHTSVFLSLINLSHLLLGGKSRFMMYIGTVPLNLKNEYQSSYLYKFIHLCYTKYKAKTMEEMFSFDSVM